MKFCGIGRLAVTGIGMVGSESNARSPKLDSNVAGHADADDDGGLWAVSLLNAGGLENFAAADGNIVPLIMYVGPDEIDEEFWQ